MRDNIAVGCVVYQDVDGVERLIESCWNQVGYIFIVDGKYRHYEDDNPYPFSTDGLDELIERYPNVVYTIAANMLEHEKRTVYLEMCEAFDIKYLLIADSDEYFSPDSDWIQFREELKDCSDSVYNIKNYTEVKDMESILPVSRPRLWLNPANMEYKNNRHYQFGLKNVVEPIVATKSITSIKLMHDPHLRSDDRQDKHNQYIKRLEEYEQMKQLIETNREKASREYVMFSS